MLEPGASEETPILVVDTGVAAKWDLNEDLEEEAARVLTVPTSWTARYLRDVTCPPDPSLECAL